VGVHFYKNFGQWTPYIGGRYSDAVIAIKDDAGNKYDYESSSKGGVYVGTDVDLGTVYQNLKGFIEGHYNILN